MRFALSPVKPHKRRHFVLAGLILAALLGCFFLIAFFSLQRDEKPHIVSISPSIGEPGSVLVITGTHFGTSMENSCVEFDGMAPTLSSYIRWEDTRIELRVPLHIDSSLVYVVTEAGRSKPKVFMSKALLPSPPSGGRTSTLGPAIESLSSESGAIGSVLTIRGLNFGANRGESQVLFTWQGDGGVQTSEDESGRAYVSPNETFGEYENWSDKEIRVRVPDGALTGGVAVKTAQATSQAAYFQIVDMPGEKKYKNRRTYALSLFASISRVQSGGSNALYVWLPFPVASAYQRDVKALNRTAEPLLADYKGLSAYRLVNIVPDKLYSIGHDYFVQVYGVSNTIRADKIRQPPSPAPRLYTDFCAPDQLVPAADSAVKDFVKRYAGGDRNPYRAAGALLNALCANIVYDAAAHSENPVTALTSGRADAWDMAVLYSAVLRAAGIPALPVAGIVVDDAQRAWLHAWAEFYIYGYGWIPVDPVLYAGGKVGNFTPPLADPKAYFGAMDTGHIAFSRGLTKLDKITPEGRTVSASRRCSFQTIFEEASGDIRSYTSFWSDIEITGVY